ncbi:MAG TPA: serine/threonine-protein kinase [Polyangia bacterium]|nr:serine/threonine-protein kinase [Polyangia bacterium]
MKLFGSTAATWGARRVGAFDKSDGPSEKTFGSGSLTNSNGDAGGSTSARSAFAAGDLLASRYKIVRLIGSGGTGEVYEALDTALGVSVALKSLKPSVAGSAIQLERFRREIQNARKVTHFNVCRIFDMGIQNGSGRDRFFLTMELLTGPTLADRIADGNAYTPEEALPIVAQIADGLDAAHAAGVVHRDLKPGNIMLLSPPTGRVAQRAVITDFGLALSEEQSDMRLTESDELVGTPEYMAPEQAEPGPATPATDIYALGLILYEMLSKRRPFESAGTALATVLVRRREPPRPLREVAPGVPAAWEAAIHRCLERDPARRFASAGAVIAALGDGRLPNPTSGSESGTGFFGRLTRKLR